MTTIEETDKHKGLTQKQFGILLVSVAALIAFCLYSHSVGAPAWARILFSVKTLAETIYTCTLIALLTYSAIHFSLVKVTSFKYDGDGNLLFTYIAFAIVFMCSIWDPRRLFTLLLLSAIITAAYHIGARRTNVALVSRYMPHVLGISIALLVLTND